MAQDATVDAYASAIYAVARSEGAIDAVENQLYQFARSMESNADLGRRLGDESIDLATRLSIVNELLGGRAHPATVSAVTYVVQSGRTRQLPAIADAVVERAAAIRRRAVAEVRSAVPLDDDRRQRLASALEQSTGREVELKVTVDPDVVGGLVVRMGDTVIDGTVARRLDELRTSLTGG
jgi:F-type H+-transporting ATPase subunit delta